MVGNPNHKHFSGLTMSTDVLSRPKGFRNEGLGMFLRSVSKGAHTVNSGELRIPYPVHNNSGLRDREIYDLFLP